MTLSKCVIFLSMLFAVTAHATDKTFLKPTAEELAMKDLAGYPGVPAVILFREEITQDDLHNVQHYERIKVLTEKGREFANVELSYWNSNGDHGVPGVQKSVDDILGRTIHADGTVIPYTGKPYKRVMQQNSMYSHEARVFTLPDVEVGSIIEYRYTTRLDEHVFEPPSWYIQCGLFVKSAHYVWYPTIESLVVNKTSASINLLNLSNVPFQPSLPAGTISWYSILPPNVKINHYELANNSVHRIDNTPQVYELSVKDVPPSPQEEFMPPIGNLTYRVLFTFSEYRSSEEFWASEGKLWSKQGNSFAESNSDLKRATQSLIVGATSSEEKLKKIYAVVESLENTDHLHQRNHEEAKISGLHKVSNAYDVLQNKQGMSRQLTWLFIAMARAAGFQAYAMLVPDRTSNVFTPHWMSMLQFDAQIAIVNYDGKDHFFDPGERFCAFGHLAWQHTNVSGIRQADMSNNTRLENTPGESFTFNRTIRVAKLTMDERGEASGGLDLTYEGSAALYWRQRSLENDDEGLRSMMQDELQKTLPNAVEVMVSRIDELSDYEQPLTVHYLIKGLVGLRTANHLSFPADLFVSNEAATFPQKQREIAVYFHYPFYQQDVLRITLPNSLLAEEIPDTASVNMPNRGVYKFEAASSSKDLVMRRDFVFRSVVVPPESYQELRSFFAKVESKDKESVLLTVKAQSSPTAK